MNRNFTNAFELVKENFIYLVSEQQNYYTSQDFQKNIIVLNKLCLDYINLKLTTIP